MGQYQDARRAPLPQTAVRLDRFYVIVASSLEYLIAECLDGVVGRGVWARTRETLSVRSSSDAANYDDRIEALRLAAARVPCVVERTFLVFGAQLVRESEVVQSTTEMHAGGIRAGCYQAKCKQVCVAL